MLGPASPTPESQDIAELRAHLAATKAARFIACQSFKTRATSLLASVGAPPPTPRKPMAYVRDSVDECDAEETQQVWREALAAKHARSAVHTRFKDTTMMAIEDIEDTIERKSPSGSSVDIKVYY